MKDKIAVMVTTDETKRGVFAGFINPDDAEKDTMEIFDVRMCVYWSEDVKGVIGLAANGPTEGCRITAAAKRGVLKGVTAVVELSPKALKAWEKEPWG